MRTRFEQVTIHVADQPLSPPVLLAPMAGITDLPFRRLVAGFGAGLVVSEMIASGELVKSRRGTRDRALTDGHGAAAVQIAGRDPALMAEAARMAEAMGAQIVDINMGCPARKVTNGASGSALMREPDHALRLIEAVVGAVEVPVTLKMRLGWDEGLLNAPEIARRAEAAGVAMITVHGRTRCQFYKGAADWAAIRATVEAVGIPVVANGDIVDVAGAHRALAFSGAAGVMVGRATIGRPWRIAEIAAGLAGQPADLRPRGGAFADLVAAHAEAHLRFYGAETGIRAMRKHLDGYLGQVPGAAPLRDRLIRETDPARLFQGIAEIGDLDGAAAEARLAA